MAKAKNTEEAKAPAAEETKAPETRVEASKPGKKAAKPDPKGKVTKLPGGIVRVDY